MTRVSFLFALSAVLGCTDDKADTAGSDTAVVTDADADAAADAAADADMDAIYFPVTCDGQSELLLWLVAD